MNNPIPSALRSHLLMLIIVGVILVGLAVVLNPQPQIVTMPELYNELDFMDFDDPLQTAQLQDMLEIFYGPKSDSLFQSLARFHAKRLDYLLENKSPVQPFSFSGLWRIFKMYINFIIIYLIVMALTWYGAQTLASWWFIRKQQQRAPFLVRLSKAWTHLLRQRSWLNAGRALRPLLRILAKGLVQLILNGLLFAPAYVIAYSLKSEVDTDSLLFLIILGVISNGLLITYANKFFILLVTESRKGYVLTARVKNLHNSYFSGRGGIRKKALFSWRKQFRGHEFQQIFENAADQYRQTIREQASFAISGLVIIEMALNIHGQFNYELLQQLLYHNYHYVLIMVFGIYLLVKITDMAVEYRSLQLRRKMETGN